ncbi:MAG: phosphodiester glycosidase family protein, partial [Chloroflexota bacterium]
TPVPTATAPAAELWQSLGPGIERRVYTPSSGFFTRITAIRLEPSLFDLRVHYQPGAPQFIDGWDTTLGDAAVIINTNFFDRQDRVTGTLFTDGQQFGDPYRRRGGIFYVDGDTIGIESNLVRSYNGEQYDQAAQAFPMLVTDGAQSYFDTRSDRATRRTVIAVDVTGRVVVLVTSFGGITLLDMASFLASSDMQLVDALNLDGGGSSMMHVDVGNTDFSVNSFDPVPAVLAAYPRYVSE